MRTLYRAARVHTLSYPATGEWLLIDERHVQRVGTGDPPQADRVVDLPGTTIVPGFIDTHVHLSGTGESLDNEDVRLVRSRAELLGLAGARAAYQRAASRGDAEVRGRARSALLELDGHAES